MKSDKKHILVVSDPLAAPGYMPRVRYLCDYLIDQGHEVTLLTEEYQPLDFAHRYPIKTIRMYGGGTFEWLLKAVWTLLTDWHNRVFAKRALSLLDSSYNIVLCSAFSYFPLGAAQQLAQAYGIPLVCDIRDLDEQVDDSRYQYRHQTWWTMPFRRIYRAIHIHRRNQVLRAARAITTVSSWHADFIRQFNPNTQVVYNGFDAAQFYPKDSAAAQFTITYIGSLFEWQKPALETVKRAIEELHNPDIHLVIHTAQDNPVKHTRIGDAIRESSLMLVLTSPHTHGMLTTKFYEALGCEKPILCVPSDQGELAELIRYTKAGIATDDKEEIKRFIIEKYHQWQANGFTRQAVQHKEQFSRRHQSEQIRQLLVDTK